MAVLMASPSPRIFCEASYALASRIVLLLVGLGADLGGLAFALGAVLLGDAFALRAHAAEHAFFDLVRQVGAFDAHVDDVNAEFLGLGAGVRGHLPHHGVALAADDGVELARRELATELAVHDVVRAVHWRRFRRARSCRISAGRRRASA